jgi:hypothetical protein
VMVDSCNICWIDGWPLLCGVTGVDPAYKQIQNNK